ncbi:MAG: rod shape-determining protein MreD [Phycisphaerae bacterium]
MRWLTFILFALLILTLQTTLAPRMQVFGCRADWVLVVVTFFALRVRPRDAVLAGWFIGALADLMTIERMGLMSVSYALAAGLVASLREFVWRDRIAAQVVVTLIASVFVRSLWGMYRHVMYAQLDESTLAVLRDIAGGSLYTAAWAPLVHAPLAAGGGVFGVPRLRPTRGRAGWIGAERV